YDAQWFQRITGKLVLMSQVRFGFLGQYNSEVGASPFERFKLGGDGMQSYQFLQGSDIIGLRGYQNFSIIPEGTNYTADTNPGSTIYDKYTFELRHPVIQSQSATIFMLAFAEGGYLCLFLGCSALIMAMDLIKYRVSPVLIRASSASRSRRA